MLNLIVNGTGLGVCASYFISDMTQNTGKQNTFKGKRDMLKLIFWEREKKKEEQKTKVCWCYIFIIFENYSLSRICLVDLIRFNIFKLKEQKTCPRVLWQNNAHRAHKAHTTIINNSTVIVHNKSFCWGV